ncbi:MAG: single-strand DNA-binding protein [Streptosporangiaceae bacterium]|jgi:single-strand DNA-binding protein|nr:single-strand binding protein [Streptosporangiaceae bacterium]MDX6434523.1 single-strand DNA-binding protein [Streptosporangiaceae bacterium]
MNDAHITLVGWLAADPFHTVTANGTPFASLRVGCTPRRFDKATGQWQDLDSMFLTVNCWRGLADNVRASDMKRGAPVLVTGRLRIREYAKNGNLRYSVEIEATTVGYDMTRGVSRFERVSRGGTTTAEDVKEALAGNDQWASDIGPAPDPDAGAVDEGAAAPVGHPGDDGRSDVGDEEDGREYEQYDARTAAA